MGLTRFRFSFRYRETLVEYVVMWNTILEKRRKLAEVLDELHKAEEKAVSTEVKLKKETAGLGTLSFQGSSTHR